MARPKKDGADVLMLKTKAMKPPKPEKDPKPAKAAKAHNTAAVSDKRSKDEIKQNFLHHWGVWKRVSAKQKLLDKEWTETKAALKADGHKVGQMQIADDLHGSPKSEAKVHAAVHDRIHVADMTDHPMGQQMDLFNQPDRTPAVDRAAAQGKRDFMENKAAKPPYDPSTPQYASYMKAYGDTQSAALKKGIKPLETEDPATPPGWGASRQRDPSRPLDA